MIKKRNVLVSLFYAFAFVCILGASSANAQSISKGKVLATLTDASNENSPNITLNAKTALNIDGFRGLSVLAAVFGRIDDDLVKSILLDRSTETVVVTDYEHHEIHEGDHYYIQDVVDLSINNVLDMQFQTPAGTKWNHFTFIISCESETEWYVYEDAGVTTTGTLDTPINNNRNIANSSGNTVYVITNTSIGNANADTDVTGALELSHGIVGAGKDGGIAVRSDEIILKPGIFYCLRAIATAAGYIDFYPKWYEHTDRN